MGLSFGGVTKEWVGIAFGKLLCVVVVWNVLCCQCWFMMFLLSMFKNHVVTLNNLCNGLT
jgi:hypothetical protein